jgi:hypothetical protein
VSQVVYPSERQIQSGSMRRTDILHMNYGYLLTASNIEKPRRDLEHISLAITVRAITTFTSATIVSLILKHFNVT